MFRTAVHAVTTSNQLIFEPVGRRARCHDFALVVRDNLVEFGFLWVRIPSACSIPARHALDCVPQVAGVVRPPAFLVPWLCSSSAAARETSSPGMDGHHPCLS